MNDTAKLGALSKVPEVTLFFWIIKIAATTLGETGGDTVTMTLNWGYLAGTALFLGAAHRAGHRADSREEISPLSLLGHDRRLHHLRHDHGRFRRPLAWHRLCRRFDAAVRLPRGGAALWYWSQRHHLGRTPSPRRRSKHSTGRPSPSRRPSAPRWATGWPTRRPGLRRRRTRLRRGARGDRRRFTSGRTYRASLLFWAAFILTRPLGATVGDFLDKPVNDGGLAFSRPLASAVIAAFIVVCLLVLPQRPGRHPDAPQEVS